MSFFSNPKSYFLILISLSFLLPFTASAGVIRKPPNNLGLVLYYPMDEGSGTTISDHSGNGRTGKFDGSIIYTPGWKNGKFGKALSFEGTGLSDGRISFTALNVTTTHTVSMWIYLASNCTNWASLFAANTGDGLYCLVNGGGGTNRIDYYFSVADHVSNTNISFNQWHHIAVVNNAGSATFYLDGVADGTAATAPAYSAVGIGNDTGSEDFPGRIDDLRVYNRAFSAAEVLALYKSGTVKVGLTDLSPGTLKNGLTGHWTFDGKDMVTNVADNSGRGNAGYLVNYTSTTTAPGAIGQSLAFASAASQYVNIPNTSGDLDPGTGDFSASFWYKGTPSGLFIADDMSSTDGIWEIGTTVAGAGVYYFAGASFAGFSTGNFALPGDTAWHHVVFRLDRSTNPDTYSVYVDGQQVSITGQTNSTNDHSIVSSSVGIGKAGFVGISYRNTPMDDVRTYNRLLTTSEITQLYNLGAGQKVAKTTTPVGTLSDGLMGHWTFDGPDVNWTTNKVTDKSGNGRTGTITNIATSTGAVIGKLGQALTFNGSNSSISLGTSSTLQPGTGVSFSVSLWYKGLKGTTESFVSSGPTCCNYWDIENNGAQFVTSSWSVSKSYTLPSDNNWHHLVIVLNRTPSPDTVEAYIDGVSQGSATGTLDDQSTAGGGGTNIGRGTWLSGGYRQGPMDEVRIYNRALSASEVTQLYNLGK